MSSNANAEEAVMPRSVAVTVAHELLTAGHRYLDVRTVKEFSGGHAVGAVNIPYMLESVSGLFKRKTVTDGCIRAFKCWFYRHHRCCRWFFSMGGEWTSDRAERAC
ncbi:thiosulfate sulfurtransferase 16, chloroplastic-like [Musa acuminata AAA Group]|uniref:thiosulfate sulfurtransferase 16, chloroplastic-like n=1 Tax=Musa acuminata AAA Group TaxID=214697 RepID=UPI0031DCABC0